MMKAYVDQAMKAIQKFNIADYGIFKACLVCFGILIGIYATKTCRKYSALIWLTFGVTYIYLMYRVYQNGGFDYK